MATSPISARRHQHGIILTPQTFGAVGDGVTDDTQAWLDFQASSGIKAVPPGRYLVNGALRRFDVGCFGNGEFDDTSAAWDEAVGDRERHSVMVHRNNLNVNATAVSPVIKTQVTTNWMRDTPLSTGFKHVLGAYHEGTFKGYYNIQADENNNFTVFGAVAKNEMAGMFGSLAGLFYVSDAKEIENPLIETMGASKNGGIYVQPTRRAKYSSGGYMFGYEAIFLNNSDDEAVAIPYVNNDEFNFNTWTACHKVSARANGAPVSAGIFMSGSNTAKHGFWNGIVVGSSCFVINGDTNGPEGTVGINLASWRDAAGWGDIGIKFRKANRHLYFREGAKVRSSHTRFMRDGGSCGVSIEGATGETQYLNFRHGATTEQEGGAVSNTAQITATATQLTMNSTAGEIILSAVDAPRVRVNSARLAPVNDNYLACGSATARWSTIYAANGTINTSDAREKRDVAPITDDVLDAWGDVNLVAFRWIESVAAKGDDARVHYGLVAQQVRDAFAARGIDATKLGLLCYDEWDAYPEQVTETVTEVKPARYEQVLVKPAEYRTEIGEDGEPYQLEVMAAQYEDGAMIEPAQYETVRTVVPAVAAGNRWGLRSDQCLFLEAAYQRRRADRIDARLAALEALI